MKQIIIEKNPSTEKLNKLDVFSWPIWEKEEVEFPWHYDREESCYLLDGSVLVTPDNGKPILCKKGDLVTFPAGMSCTWKIQQAVRKHYRFA